MISSLLRPTSPLTQRAGFVVLLVALTTVLAAPVTAEDRPPNIVFIITDDQTNDQLGYLEGEALTPNLDRMANEGVVFNRSYVASSVCSPSRYTVLSGQYASRVALPFFKQSTTEEGVCRVLWNVGFSPGQPTLQSVLQENGYTTGMIGKWHINGVGTRPAIPPKGSDPADPEMAAMLRANHDAICEGIKRHGFDWVDHAYAGNLHDDKRLMNTGLAEHNMEWLTDAALRFIEESRDEPFFLYFATTLNHVPDPNKSLRKADPRVSGEGLLPEPITGIMPPRETIYERLAEAGVDEKHAMALWLDDGIGAVLNKLETLGIADNTLVIFFNDHGMADKSKGTLYEGGLITPTLAYWPGRIEPQVVDAMTQNTDFAPTILDAAGIEPPADMVLDGHSWLPLVDGEVDAIRDSVYTEIGLVRAVSTPEWKYIAFRVPPSLQRTLDERMADHVAELERTHEQWPWTKSNPNYQIDPDARYHQMGMAAGGSRFERGQRNADAAWFENYFDADQLYHLSVDPLEGNNLANDPAHAATLAEMQAELRRYLERLPDTFEDYLDAN
ncbi:MAG: sulfatase-like hydrolase/transferase [Planctomycetota bacterium]